MKKLKEFLAAWKKLSKKERSIELWFFGRFIAAWFSSQFYREHVVARVEARYAKSYLTGLLDNRTTIEMAGSVLNSYPKDDEVLITYKCGFFGKRKLTVRKSEGVRYFSIKGREV